MEPPQLPEDVNHWPRNPFRLFGVSPGVGKKELRKAYTVLIRKFKPERFPEQFRRIRDAYEFLLEFGSMPNAFGGGFPVHLHPDRSQNATDLHPPAKDVSEPEKPEVVETESVGPFWPSSQLELDASWQKACTGNPDEAYRELSQMAIDHPNQTDFLLSAYWLLVAFPELDADRMPTDWLVKGIRLEGCTGAWRELLARELYHQPELAVSEAISNLLHVLASPVQLANIVAVRWSALEQLDEWEILAKDMATLRPRMWREDDQSWMRLLLTSCEFTAWPKSMTARKLFDRSREEIEGITHLHELFREDLSRLDYLVEVSQAWHAVSGREDIPKDFLDLIPMTWTHPFAETRLTLYAVLQNLLKFPQKTLTFFDRLQTIAPSVLAQFGNLLAQLEHERKEFIAPCNPSTQIAVWLSKANAGSRAQLLSFCLEEGVTPDDIANFGELRRIDPEWMFQIRNDLPIQFLSKAHHLFWS